MKSVGGPWSDFGLSYPEHTLDGLVSRHARDKGGEPAVISPAGTLSWAELDERASRLAAAFAASGCEPGDRIGWLGKNGIDFPVVVLAVRRAGLVLVGFNWRLSREELATIVAIAGPKMVLGNEEFAELLPDGVPFVANGALLEQKIAAHSPADPHAERPDEISTIFFTSGTTGEAKPLAYTAEAVMKTVYAPHTLDFDEQSRILIVAPVFHTAGWIWTLYGLAGGMTQVQLPSASPPDMLAAVERWGVTHAQWVPAMLRATVDTLEENRADLSSLRLIAYGSSPIAEGLLAECRRKFGCEFSQVYGLTESVGPITHLPPEAHSRTDEGKSQATGIANPGVELRIVDHDGRDLGPGETGEILARLPYPIGMLWRPEGRSEPVVDEEGWLHTGDIGVIDEDGYLSVTDRKKDMIISGGENVYPAEVENVLAGLPGVAEAAVFGVPDQRWGETVVAAVVPRGDDRLDCAALIAACRDRLAHYKCPTRIHQTACLPRNASGKVLRRELPGIFGAS